jgi:hypothetical protein
MDGATFYPTYRKRFDLIFRQAKMWNGGEGGIRTHGTVSRTQHFQCCQLSHSCTSPLVVGSGQPTSGRSAWTTLAPRCCQLSTAHQFVAERVGFEPTVPLRAQRFSRPPDSAALAPLRFTVGFDALFAKEGLYHSATFSLKNPTRDPDSVI